MKLNKKWWYHKFLDYRQRRSRGSYWLGLLEEYVPFQKVIDLVWTGLAAKIAIQGATFKSIFITGLWFLGYKVFMEATRLIIATVDYKRGIWLAEIDWEAKNKKYNIYSVQAMDTMREIAKKVGAKDHFTDLEECQKDIK